MSDQWLPRMNGKEVLLRAFVDLGLYMICIEAALKRGWPDQALTFVTNALEEIDETIELLKQHDISCNEITKRTLTL